MVDPKTLLDHHDRDREGNSETIDSETVPHPVNEEPLPPKKFLRGLEETLKSVLSQTDAGHRADLIEFFDKPVCPVINYDKYGFAFTSLYFWENFWKYFVLFHREDHPPRTDVVDLGAGSGTASLAYIAWLAASDQQVEETIVVTLVDRSEVQLSLAKSLLAVAHQTIDCLKITPVTIHSDIKDLHPSKVSGKLTLLGHVLGENLADENIDIESLLSRSIQCTAEGGRLYVVERQDDPFWTDFNDYTSTKPIRMSQSEIEVTVAQDEPSQEQMPWRAQYARLDVPPSYELFGLADDYFDAWRQQSVTALEDLFHPEATYQEGPFTKPLNGIEAIQDYWNTEVNPQKNTQIEITDVAYTDDEVFVEWCAEFGLKQVERRTVKGIIVLEQHPNSEQIVSLREYFSVRDKEISHDE